MKSIKPMFQLLMLALLVFSLGCADQEEVDTGGVALQVEFVDSVFRVGVNENDSLSIPTIEIDSIILNPSAPTSDLMNVNLELYEVTFARGDSGTRVPPPFVFRLTGLVPVGGQLSLDNFPVMSVEQFRTPPLSDLLFENGGFDKETGSSNIRLSLTFVAFGKTLGGSEVTSVPRTQTFEFVPTLVDG